MAQHRRRNLRGMVMVVILLVLSISSVAFGFLWNADKTVNDHLTRIDSVFPADSSRPGVTGTVVGGIAEHPQTILMVGSTVLPRSAQTRGFSADSLMVIRVAADRSRVDVISLPADAMVAIPGFGTDRISAATTRGGLPLAIQTVESLLQTRIDHVVAIDLDGVATVTDALGGVDVEVERPFRAGGFDYSAGTHRLTGEQALSFVREQASLPGRDLDRNAHQREYLRGLAGELTSARLFADPARLLSVLAAAADNVAVDAELTPSTLRTLAFSLRSLSPADVHTWPAPVHSVQVSGSGPLTVHLSADGLRKLRKSLADDQFAGAPDR